jgi:hypothetical protein
MKRLSDSEFRACRILLAFARIGANFDHMAKQMRREGIPEETWRLLYHGCGMQVLIQGHGDDAERYVYAPDNLVPFAPKTLTKCRRPEVQRSGGSAA